MPRREISVNFRIITHPSEPNVYVAELVNAMNLTDELRALTYVARTPKEARDGLRLKLTERLTRTKVKLVVYDTGTQEFIRNVEMHPFVYFAEIWREAPAITNCILDAADQTVGYAKTIWDMHVAARKLQGKFMRIYACLPHENISEIPRTSLPSAWESAYITNLRHDAITAGLQESVPASETETPNLVEPEPEPTEFQRETHNAMLLRTVLMLENRSGLLWATIQDGHAVAMVTFGQTVLGKFNPKEYRDARGRRRIAAFTSAMVSLCPFEDGATNTGPIVRLRENLVELFTSGKLEYWFLQLNSLMEQYPDYTIDDLRGAREDGRFEQ